MKGLILFKTSLEPFNKETRKIESANEDKKFIEYIKVVLDKASRLYNTLLELYANKFNRLEKNRKKKIIIKIVLKT